MPNDNGFSDVSSSIIAFIALSFRVLSIFLNLFLNFEERQNDHKRFSRRLHLIGTI